MCHEIQERPRLTNYESYRCRQQLGKVIGVEPAGNCVGDDPEQLQLGSFVENGDKGCVMWTMSATKTM